MAKTSRGSSTEKHKRIFATRLRLLLDEKPNATQAQLSEAIGMTQQTVSQYANGISEPGYDALVKIADYFDVSLDYLLGRSEAKTTDLCIQAICEKTGLSEDSVNLLRSFAEPTDNTNPFFCYLSSYAFELVNEFIDFALSAHKEFGFPFTTYCNFRQQNDIHRENAEKWGQAPPEETERIPFTIWSTHEETLEYRMFQVPPAAASDFFRKEFCDNFKDYLKAKYPLVDYPIPPGYKTKIGELESNGND